MQQDKNEAPAKEVRCLCGHLVAIKTPRGIEIKCKRCKQVHVIPFVAEKTN